MSHGTAPALPLPSCLPFIKPSLFFRKKYINKFFSFPSLFQLAVSLLAEVSAAQGDGERKLAGMLPHGHWGCSPRMSQGLVIFHSLGRRNSFKEA